MGVSRSVLIDEARNILNEHLSPLGYTLNSSPPLTGEFVF